MYGAHNYPDNRKPVHQLLASGIRYFRKVLLCLVKRFGLVFDIFVSPSSASQYLQPICSRRAKDDCAQELRTGVGQRPTPSMGLPSLVCVSVFLKFEITNCALDIHAPTFQLQVVFT